MRIGFIGAGNMTSAITKGAVDLGILYSKDVYIYDRNDYKTRELCEKYGFNICRSQGEAEIKTDILVVAVKPANAKDVFSGISKAKAVISIVAGYSYADIKGCVLKKDIRFLRIMPNTPLAVGEGLSAFALPTDFTEEELNEARRIFGALGKVEEIDEKYFSAVTAVSGSGPAYVYMFIEALADAGVKHGLKRDVALTLAAQTVYGSSKMVLETNIHPAMLKDAVTSPGGTTIEATSVLEKNCFRGAIIAAVDACVKKADNLK